MHFKILSLATGLVITAILVSCSNAPTNTQAAPSSPASSTVPGDAMKGDAMKGDAMTSDAMKGDIMSPSPTTNP